MPDLRKGEDAAIGGPLGAKMDRWIRAGLVSGGLAGCPKETDGDPASTGATASVGAGSATSTTACQ